MQPRKHRLEIPNKPHYLTIDVEGRGTTSWRVPSMAKSAKILALINEAGIVEAMAQPNPFAALGSKINNLFCCQGALLGMCWYDQNVELSTKSPDKSSGLLEYGEKVFEELHEAEWDWSSVNVVFEKLMNEIIGSFISNEEVDKKVDFLSQETAS